jgi:hypothetical protein
MISFAAKVCRRASRSESPGTRSNSSVNLLELGSRWNACLAVAVSIGVDFPRGRAAAHRRTLRNKALWENEFLRR